METVTHDDWSPCPFCGAPIAPGTNAYECPTFKADALRMSNPGRIALRRRPHGRNGGSLHDTMRTHRAKGPRDTMP